MAATERKLALTEPSGVSAPAGKCVSGTVDGCKVMMIGSSAGLTAEGVPDGGLGAIADALRADVRRPF